MAAHRFGGIGVAALAAAALALGACGGGGGDERSVEDDLEAALEDAAAATEEETTTTEPEPREVEPVAVDVDVPRETTYAAATWTVTDVAFQAAGVDEYGSETEPLAIVGFTVANDGEGATDLTVDQSRLSLLDVDGNRLAAPFETMEQDVVVVGGESDFEVAFVLDEDATDDDLPDYTFQVGDEGYEPAPIPLSGDVPVSGYPVTVTMPAAVDGEMNGGPATIRNMTGTVSLDYAGQRTEEGTRFFTVHGEMQGHDGGSFHPAQSDVAVSVDGIQADTAYPSIDMPDSFANGTTAAATWVFVIPANGKEGMVHFGWMSEPSVPGGPFTFPTLP
jgi:hypothetical protein